MTASFILKLRRFLDTLFQSYQSQLACIFSDYIIKRYGNVLHLKTQYYQPSRIVGKLGLSRFLVLNKELSQGRVSDMLRSTTKETFQVQTEISRLRSPGLDSYILAQYLTYIASTYKFNQLIYFIEKKLVYRYFISARVDYDEKDSLHYNDPVIGLELGLHGRIPREPVRARKTVQVKTLGRRSGRLVNKNVIMFNRAGGIHPELGTFSIWTHIIV